MSRESEGSQNPLPRQARVGLEHRFDGLATAQLLQDEIDGDAGSRNDRLPIITMGSATINGSVIMTLQAVTLAGSLASLENHTDGTERTVNRRAARGASVLNG